MVPSCVEPLERRTLLSTSIAGFSETQFVAGLNQPTAMEFAPDGRLFVSEKGGTLRVVKNGNLLPQPFVTVPVSADGERGLSGIAFDPNFAANRFVYVYYTAASPAIHNRVSRFTADPSNGDVAVPGSEMDLLDLPALGPTNHNGGAIHFGADGKLYVGVGENGNPANAQSLDTPLGKLLRINKDGSIPTDNPFYNQTTGTSRAIWALGLRNPFTFAVQPGTGRLFINDLGQETWEEIDVGAAGANYGWPITEGPTTDARFVGPLYAYHHGANDETGGNAIAGGTFYNPPASANQPFPAEYTGDYFYADYTGGYIKVIDLSNGGAPGAATTFATGLGAASGVVDLKVGPDGALYAANIGRNSVDRFTYSAGEPQTSTVTLAANVPGLQLTLDGQPAATPINFTAAPGVRRTIGAPDGQSVGGAIYDFVSWSDGGAAIHEIATPDTDAAYTAVFQPRVAAAAGPDLTASVAGTLPGLIVGGDKGKVAVTVGNAGTESFHGRVAVRLLLSTDGIVDPGDALVKGFKKQVRLGAGDEKSTTVKFAFPSVEDGNYVLLAEVDPDNAVIETNEGNNVGVTQQLIVRKPVIDLSGTFVLPTPTALTGGDRSFVDLSVLNAGNVTARGTMKVILFAATDNTGAAGAIPIGMMKKRLTLTAGARKNLRLRFKVPADLPPGNYFFSAALDADSQLPESDEANNLAVSTDSFVLT